MSAFHTNLLQGISEPANQSSDELAQIARSQGYTVKGNQAVKNTPGNAFFHGVPVSTDLSQFAGGGPSFLDQAGQILGNEYQAKQGAADRQFDRNAAQTSSFQQFVGGLQGRVGQFSGDNTGFLDKLIGSTAALGDKQAGEVRDLAGNLIQTARAQAAGAVGGIDQYVKGGVYSLNSAAAAAEGTARGAISQYSTAVDENVIQATVNGIQRNAQSQRQFINAGINPDGTRMTAEERAAATRNLNFDTGTQIAQTAAAVRSQAQQTLASLRTNLANVELEGGKLRGSAAELGVSGEQAKLAAGDRVTQAQQVGLNAILNSEAGRRELQSLIANLGQFRSQLNNGNQLAALQLELGGRQSVADMVRNNPETVFGILSSFLALGGVATAPGGQNIRAINVPQPTR